MAHLVRNIVNRERVTGWIRQTRYATGFSANAGRVKLCNTAAARTKDVTDVVIAVADPGVESRLILVEHRGPAIVGVRIVSAGARFVLPSTTCIIVAREDNKIIVRDDCHLDSYVPIIYSVYAIHDQDLGRQTARDRVAANRCAILIGCGKGKAIRAELRAGDDFG